MGNVALVAAVASLASWALLAVLERCPARAARWWLVVATVFMVASLIGPLTVPDVPGSSRVVLAILHVVVGAVLIPLLYRSARHRKEQRR